MKKYWKALIVAVISATAVVTTSYAAFIANGSITISGVTFGSSTADLVVLSGSTADSIDFSSGAFSVTNPGTFRVGSADANVKSVIVDNGTNNTVACSENSTPGTSYVTLPTAAGTYTVKPSDITACTSLCSGIPHATSYASFPSCQPASCETGYNVINGSCVFASGSGLPATSQPSENPTPTPTLTPTPAPLPPATEDTYPCNAANQLSQISCEADIAFAEPATEVANFAGYSRTVAAEKDATAIVNRFAANAKAPIKDRIIYFVTYGTRLTKVLGAGERAGVVNSFLSAYGRLPSSEVDWSDVIKLSTGRWPTQRNAAAEARASVSFNSIYGRKPVMKDARDEAAIMIMAYGMRPSPRSPAKEAAAIKIYRAIFNRQPVTATAWDAVRAIAQSGAKR